MPGIASPSAGDDSIGRTMTPDAPGLLEAPEMVRRELPADAEHLGDLRGLRVLHPSEREQHTEADVAILPVPRIEPVHLGFSAGHVVSAPAVDLLLVDEPVLDQGVQVVPRGADRQAEGPRDGPEMVAWERAQMGVDLPTDGMLESGQEAESDQERASPVRQHPRARSGGRPDEHADRPDSARIGVIPPAPPLHENLNPVIHSTRRISILW